MRRNVISRSAALGLMLGCAIAAWVPAFAAVPANDTSPLVAQWSGGGITVNEMLKWWSYGSPAERKPVTTLAEKEEFLNSLVNARLMIDKAESLGITNLPTVADFYRGRRISMTNEKLLTLATEGRITVSDKDVDEVYRKRATEMELRQIIVPKLDLARALRDSIRAGVSFEDLARRYSTAPTGNDGGLIGKVRWGDFTEVFSAQAMRLEAGQVSEPFQVPGGWCILKMDSKVLKEPGDPAAEKKSIRARLERDAAMRERTAYMDSLKMA
jgi:peptidyl-prolyl cis-trans isomerase C